MRKVAVLAAIAALLAVCLLLVDRAPSGGGAGGAGRLLPTFEPSAVRRITIARAGSAPFSLERQPAGAAPAWKETPGDRPADTAAVEDLLNALDVAETTRSADLTAAAAGLSPPKVTIALDRPGGATTVALGRPDAGQGVFVRLTGSPAVRVAPRRLLELADRDAEAFRDHRLVPFAPTDVARIAWRRADGSERVLARDDGRWKDPVASWLSNARVEEALRRLLALRAARYRPSGAPGATPLRIEVGLTGGRRMVLAPGAAGCGAAETFVERDAIEGACVPADAWEGVLRSLEAALEPDRRLVSSPPAAIRRVEASDGARRLVLVRSSATSWHLEAPKESYLVDPHAVDDWLAALGQVDVRSRPVPRQPGLRHLVVEDAYRQEADVAPGDPGYALLDPEPLRFRDRAVLDFAHFDARDLRRSAGGRTTELASRDGEDWRAVSPAGSVVAGANVARVIGALGNLRAESFLVTAPEAAPELTLDVAVQPPGEAQPTRHTLDLTKTKEAPGCAGRLDRETWFLLAQAACDELRLPLTK
jgi:hypothetical protein